MLKIRLQRTGKKHEPTFRVLLTDSKNSTKSGRFLEILGSYDPRDKNETTLKVERIQHWISKGAKPSDTIHNLLITKGVIKGEKINVLPQKSPVVDEEAIKAKAEVEAALKAKEEAEAATAKEAEENPAEESPSEEVATETPAEEKVEEVATEEVKEA